MHPQALHPAPGLLASPQLPVQMQPAGKVRLVIKSLRIPACCRETVLGRVGGLHPVFPSPPWGGSLVWSREEGVHTDKALLSSPLPVGLCNHQPAWPSAPLHPAQPESKVLPQVTITFIFSLGPNPCPWGGSLVSQYQANKIYLPLPPAAVCVASHWTAWRVGSGWQESQGDSRVGCNELSSGVHSTYSSDFQINTHLIRKSSRVGNFILNL